MNHHAAKLQGDAIAQARKAMNIVNFVPDFGSIGIHVNVQITYEPPSHEVKTLRSRSNPERPGGAHGYLTPMLLPFR